MARRTCLRAESAGQTPSRPRSPVQQPSDRPILPAGIRELFLRGDSATPAHYAPVLYGAAKIHFTDARRGIDCTLDVHADVPFRDGRDCRGLGGRGTIRGGAGRAARSARARSGRPIRGTSRGSVGPQVLCRLDARLRTMAGTNVFAQPLLGPVARPDFAARRKRTRLPHPRSAGCTRGPRCRGREASCAVRAEGATARQQGQERGGGASGGKSSRRSSRRFSRRSQSGQRCWGRCWGGRPSRCRRSGAPLRPHAGSVDR